MKVEGICGSLFLTRFISTAFDYYNKTLWVVFKPWLGVTLQSLKLSKETGELLQNQLLVIKEVIQNSPAEKMGLKSGDIILQLNKNEISGYSQYNLLLNNLKPGEKATILIKRGEEKIEKEFTVEPMYYSENK